MIPPLAMLMEFRAGDIFACYGRGLVSRAISAATISLMRPAELRFPPSHVALCSPWDGQLVWSESTTLVQRQPLNAEGPVQGWQVHQIRDRLDDYAERDEVVDLYRLHPYYEMTEDDLRELEAASVGYWLQQRTPYDMPQAIFSGLRLLPLTRLYPRGDLQAIFCSEYIAAVLVRLGRLNPERNPATFSPGRLLRRLVRAGIYRRIRTYRKDLIQIHAA